MEEYKKTFPVSIILECFGVKRSTFYRWKQECKNSQKRDEIADKIEQLCMKNHFIYGYRTITRLLKKVYKLVVNRKKVYRIMKEKGCLCRVRPKKGPKLGKPYHVKQTISWIVISRQTSLWRNLSQTSPTSILKTVDFIYLQSWISIIVKL